MEIKLYTSIMQVERDEWDSIIKPNKIICSHDYLEAVEKSGINDCTFYYPVVYNNGKIVAHTSAYTISTELDLFAQGFAKKIVNLIRRRWKNFLIMKSVECGTPVELGTTMSFSDGIDKSEAFDLMCGAIEELAKKLRINMILFRDFYDEETGFFDRFEDRGYLRIHNLQNTKIELRWKTFDEYLEAMKSNYRRKIIKRMEVCRKNNVTVSVLKQFSAYGDDLVRLWENVNKNAKEYCREKLTLNFFKNIDRCMGDRSQVILLKRNDVPVGSALLLLDEKTLISMYYGLDYELNKENFLYFNLLYETVKLAFETGKKQVDIGITTLNPKKDLGAETCTLHMYMRYGTGLLSKAVPKLFDLMTPQDKEGARRVFKHDKREDETGGVKSIFSSSTVIG